MIDLAALLVGGKEGLAKRPIFSCTQCPISPLSFEAGLSEAQVEFARAGIPVVSMVAAVAGLTSPATLSGTIAQVNAENLASLVITQSAERHAPWIYSSDSVPGNFTTGSIDYGALEANLLRTGAGQMGRFYGLPTMVAGLGIEGSSKRLCSLTDGIPYMVVQGLVPSDLGSGLGGLDQAAGAAFDQLLVDSWIWDLAREFTRDFDADEAAISFETLREAALDGNFLSKRHTLARFKKEFAATTKPEAILSGTETYGSPGEVLRKARAEVEKMLKSPRTQVVAKDESQDLEDYVESIRKSSA
jgi:trimethylamine--corrinoid protein Co-methyltransferase